MAQIPSISGREFSKFIESPTRPGDSVIESVDSGSFQYTTLVDDVSKTISYFGFAKPGQLESDLVWSIKKLTVVGSVSKIQWAEGSSSFDKSWALRSTYSYS